MDIVHNISHWLVYEHEHNANQVYLCICVYQSFLSVALYMLYMYSSVCVCMCIVAMVSLIGVSVFARQFYGDAPSAPFGWSFALTIVGLLFFAINGCVQILLTIMIHLYVCRMRYHAAGRSRSQSVGIMGFFSACFRGYWTELNWTADSMQICGPCNLLCGHPYRPNCLYCPSVSLSVQYGPYGLYLETKKGESKLVSMFPLAE